MPTTFAPHHLNANLASANVCTMPTEPDIDLNPLQPTSRTNRNRKVISRLVCTLQAPTSTPKHMLRPLIHFSYCRSPSWIIQLLSVSLPKMTRRLRSGDCATKPRSRLGLECSHPNVIQGFTDVVRTSRSELLRSRQSLIYIRIFSLSFGWCSSSSCCSAVIASSFLRLGFCFGLVIGFLVSLFRGVMFFKNASSAGISGKLLAGFLRSRFVHHGSYSAFLHFLSLKLKRAIRSLTDTSHTQAYYILFPCHRN